MSFSKTHPLFKPTAYAFLSRSRQRSVLNLQLETSSIAARTSELRLTGTKEKNLN